MLQYYLISDTVRSRLTIQSITLYYHPVNKDFNNIRSCHVATDHMSIPNTFWWGKKKKKVKPLAIATPLQSLNNPILSWNSKSITFNTFEREYKFQLKYGNLRYLTWIKRTLLCLGQKQRILDLPLPGLKHSKDVANISILQRMQCSKIKKTSIWVWRRRVFNLVHFTPS